MLEELIKIEAEINEMTDDIAYRNNSFYLGDRDVPRIKAMLVRALIKGGREAMKTTQVMLKIAGSDERQTKLLMDRD